MEPGHQNQPPKSTSTFGRTQTGENKTTARHDLVLLTEVEGALKRDVLFESKCEQPSLVARSDGIDCPAMSKAYWKLLMEEGRTT